MDEKCKKCGQPRELFTPIGAMYLVFSKDGLCSICQIKRKIPEEGGCLGQNRERRKQP